MAILSSIIKRLRGEYASWEADSKNREKRRLDQIYSKRARGALQHVYKMERMKRNVAMQQQIAAAKEAQLKARKAKSELRALRIKDIKAYASLFGIGGGRRARSRAKR